MMGTPSYMAPEQVVGSNAQLTSATDVYGLGAVLYQSLTGHLPFAADTTYETIRLLLETEPREPRLLNPKLYRRAFHHLPQMPRERSKASIPIRSRTCGRPRARLKHEPIQAKRSGFVGHARKWVQRNPAIAALVVSLIALAAAVSWNIWESELIGRPSTKSVAVLPFTNLSEEGENAIFADGVQDEILTGLARIADLKVISRASTIQYKSEVARNLRKIGRELGVANVVEGTVQRAGNRVRVNATLIDARTDRQLWGQSYDRDFADVFAIQSEIATSIARQLRAKLTGHEEQVLAAKPTDNPQAYDVYMRGLAYTLKTEDTPAQYIGAQKYLREAVRLDPKFALAWALLSYTDAIGYSTRILQPTDALREEARQAAETALSLQPNLGEALMAKGYYHYACLKDYDTATRYLERARQLLPNDSRIPEVLAYVTRRRGQWDRSVGLLQRS